MGKYLLDEVSRATGLPEELVSGELTKIVSKTGKQASEITMDDLRELLAEYLQDVLIEAQQRYSP